MAPGVSDTATTIAASVWTEVKRNQYGVLHKPPRRVKSNEGVIGCMLWVAPRRIRVDRCAYQRSINNAFVDAMVTRIAATCYFPWQVMTTIVCMTDRHNNINCIDGQHRLALAIRLGLDSIPVHCYFSADPADEARLMGIINTSHKVKAITVFHAMKEAGDAFCCRVDALTREAGFSVAPRNARSHKRLEPKQILAIDTLQMSVKTLGRRFVSSMRSLARVFGPAYHKEITAGAMLWGWRLFYLKHVDNWSPKFERHLQAIFENVSPKTIEQVSVQLDTYILVEEGEAKKALNSTGFDRGKRICATLERLMELGGDLNGVKPATLVELVTKHRKARA